MTTVSTTTAMMTTTVYTELYRKNTEKTGEKVKLQWEKLKTYMTFMLLVIKLMSFYSSKSVIICLLMFLNWIVDGSSRQQGNRRGFPCQSGNFLKGTVYKVC